MKIVRNAVSSKDLGSSVLSGASWIFASRMGARILRTVRMAVLARVLTPKDFGTFALAFLTVEVLTMCLDSGFIQALIHKKTDTERYLDTAWTFGIIRRLALAAGLFALAPQAALFFNAPEAAPVIRFLSASLIFRAAANIAVVFFEKDLAYQKFFRYEFIGTAVDFSVSIGSAFLLRNYWALAWGFLAGVAAQSTASFIMSPFRPRLRLDVAKARELFRYGKWIVLSGLLLYLGSNLGQIFVGKILGTAMLGFFLMASKTADLALGEISRVVTRVVFPAVSKIQDDAERLQSVWVRVMRAVWSLTLPVAVVILFLAPEITVILLGPQWLEAVPAIRLLTASGAAMAGAQAASPFFRGTGHPRSDALMQTARVLVLLLVLYPLSMAGGIAGAAAGTFIGAGAAAALSYFLSRKILRVPSRRYFDAFWPPATAAMAMAGAILLMKEILAIKPVLTVAAVAGTAAAAVIGTGIYGLMLVLVSRLRPEWSLEGELELLGGILKRTRPECAGEELP